MNRRRQIQTGEDYLEEYLLTQTINLTDYKFMDSLLETERVVTINWQAFGSRHKIAEHLMLIFPKC